MVNDVAFIYIKTPNAEDPDISVVTTMLQVNPYHEISWIEGDDEKRAPG